MTSDRIKEIQETTAYPESISVYKALLQVWVESLEDNNKYSEEDLHKAYCAGSDFDMSCLKDEQYYMFKEWFEQFKKK